MFLMEEISKFDSDIKYHGYDDTSGYAHLVGTLSRIS